jgi:hypothetical protein
MNIKVAAANPLQFGPNLPPIIPIRGRALGDSYEL